MLPSYISNGLGITFSGVILSLPNSIFGVLTLVVTAAGRLKFVVTTEVTGVTGTHLTLCVVLSDFLLLSVSELVIVLVGERSSTLCFAPSNVVPICGMSVIPEIVNWSDALFVWL